MLLIKTQQSKLSTCSETLQQLTPSFLVVVVAEGGRLGAKIKEPDLGHFSPGSFVTLIAPAANRPEGSQGFSKDGTTPWRGGTKLWGTGCGPRLLSPPPAPRGYSTGVGPRPVDCRRRVSAGSLRSTTLGSGSAAGVKPVLHAGQVPSRPRRE